MKNEDANGSFNVVETTITDIHAAFERGQLTAAKLVDQFVAQIDAYDGDLNTILTI